ncbi:hypothetical protein OG756_02400 [Streptomyces sp. NBC_01310]|uniref:hypothetical protein n=1 Tax=Streptomyces sp. NBC_01310 TaxID=2903820 RepID=UPI0035B60CC4|nr:hypothetical protein OG756_02400 [Streptomyces sp. NBC_01310]
MAKQRKPNQGEEISRHSGAQHGWSPDVDATHQQENPSAKRSFQPEKHAPAPGPGRKVSKEEEKGSGVDVGKSEGRRGEQRASKGKGKGMHDLGPQGASRRPSGTRDASAVTGVDPQDPPGKRSGG